VDRPGALPEPVECGGVVVVVPPDKLGVPVLPVSSRVEGHAIFIREEPRDGSPGVSGRAGRGQHAFTAAGAEPAAELARDVYPFGWDS
jgi:hypothetical protein